MHKLERFKSNMTEGNASNKLSPMFPINSVSKRIPTWRQEPLDSNP